MEIATAAGPSVLPTSRPAGEIPSGGAPPLLEVAPVAKEEKPAAAPDLLFGEITPESLGLGQPSRAESVAGTQPLGAPEVRRGVTMQMPEDFGLPEISKPLEQEFPTPVSLTTPSQGPVLTEMPPDIFPPFGREMPEPEGIGLGEPEPVGPRLGTALPTFDIEPELEPLRLDDLIAEGEIKVPAPAAPESPLQPETVPLDLDLMGVGVAQPEAPPTAERKLGIFYEQAFESEPVGAMPKNWEPPEQYGFASLVVAEDSPPPNAKRYVKFEKTEGSGSACYSCRFPDATGQVAIEFDLRCDHKNKFLLGFYVEKDGDFRQSIHTLVHQAEPDKPASLGLQGEKTPYVMGTWPHIKYVVNLSTGRLSGYVNGTIVLDNVRLTNCPRSLNTLSIRDNIPTVGVLKIGNIRIARA